MCWASRSRRFYQDEDDVSMPVGVEARIQLAVRVFQKTQSISVMVLVDRQVIWIGLNWHFWKGLELSIVDRGQHLFDPFATNQPTEHYALTQYNDRSNSVPKVRLSNLSTFMMVGGQLLFDTFATDHIISRDLSSFWPSWIFSLRGWEILSDPSQYLGFSEARSEVSWDACEDFDWQKSCLNWSNMMFGRF